MPTDKRQNKQEFHDKLLQLPQSERSMSFSDLYCDMPDMYAALQLSKLSELAPVQIASTEDNGLVLEGVGVIEALFNSVISLSVVTLRPARLYY